MRRIYIYIGAKNVKEVATVVGVKCKILGCTCTKTETYICKVLVLFLSPTG